MSFAASGTGKQKKTRKHIENFWNILKRHEKTVHIRTVTSTMMLSEVDH